MGDYNINLLNGNTHNATSEFINALYCQSVYPLINKQTRITKFSATIIDNIHINNISYTINTILNKTCYLQIYQIIYPSFIPLI